MKDFWDDFGFGGVLFVMVLAVWLAPLIAGVFDSACWFFAAGQCTSINWNSRAPAALLWTVTLPVLFILFAAG